MPFICQNQNCAIAISKQEFAKQLFDVLNGNCPECQQPLVELKVEPLISEEDEQLIASLPYVIAYPLKQTLSEKDPVKRIYLFNYTFLNYLKYLGLLSASEFFNSSFKDRSMVALFHKNLMETTFGKWNDYIRNTLIFLKQNNHIFFCTELLSYYELVESGDKVKKFNGEIEYNDTFGDLHVKKQQATAIGILINFRNRNLGHGTPPDDQKSQKLWEDFFPIFRSLLEQMSFAKNFPMYKKEHGETYLLQSSEIESIEISHSADADIWIQDYSGNTLNILPFFIVPAEVAMTREDKAKIFTYESYTGSTIKFFSPEGIEKQTSGKILEKLNLLLRDKQKEIPFAPDTFTKEIFLKRIEEENKLLLDTLISEKKIIPGVYQHREQMEIKSREWIGARANIFFIAAEAGSGKTNLLAEIQRQYTERGYPGLLIRAGRMEKNTLREQVAYLLNIDTNEGFDKYTAIAGTQADPSFILIDGLNEANNAEAIWQEILEWSKIIEPGSIKFVVTSRANTKSDLERYKTEESDLNFLYGENKDHEKGLGAFAFWLTPLDMNEMKGTWDNYVAKDKSRYKPKFSFDDIATFDRAIYNQINNPLVLRLFLEIYNGKNLPKKGGKHLHIWKDWFNTFSQEEQTFLKLLADEVWLKGENELLLDDLLNNELLKPYLTSDLVNSPYARMKNMGWVSRYVKDMNACLGFTVEGALLYLMGVKLQEQEAAIELNYIQNTLSTGTKLQQSAIESCLCEQALTGDLGLATELIDAGTEQMDLCIRPLLYFMKAYGVEVTISKVLAEPTENDWKALLHLNQILDYLQAYDLQSEFSNKLLIFSEQNKLNVNVELLISVLPMASADFKNEYVSIIESQKLNNENLESLAYYYTFNGYPKKAVEIYESLFDYNEISDPHALNRIAVAYHMCEKFVDAKNIYLKALETILVNSKSYSSLMAMLYFNIATVDKSSIENSIEYLKKAIKIGLELYGEIHGDVIDYYVALANHYDYINDIDSKKEIIKKLIKISGKEINNYLINAKLAGYYYSEGDYVKALNYYEIAFQIKANKYGELNIENIEPLLNLGYVFTRLKNYQEAISKLLVAQNIIDQNEIYSNDRLLIMGNLATNYNNSGYYDKAIVVFESLFELINKNIIEGIVFNKNYYATIYHYADTLYNNDQFEKSIELINELPESHLGNKKVMKLLSNNYYCLKQYDKAIEFYQKLLMMIKSESEKVSIYEYIAASYQSIGKFEIAISNYLTIIDLAKKLNLNEEIITSYFRIGYCYSESKMYKNAIDYFKLGLEISNRDYFIKYIAESYENEDNQSAAFENYLEYASRINKAEKSDNEQELNDALNNVVRLSKTMSREADLPVWIKNFRQ